MTGEHRTSTRPDRLQRNSVRERMSAVAILVSLGMLAGVISPTSSALAARGHVFESAFGGPGSAPGQLDEPSGVAINEATGDVYVVDKGNDRVEWFSAEGAYLGQVNGSGLLLSEGKAAGSGGLASEIPTGRFDEPEGIAVDNSCQEHGLSGAACEAFDPSNEDVYVLDAGHSAIDKFSPTGVYIGQLEYAKGVSFIESQALLPTEKMLLGVAVGSGGEVSLYVNAYLNVEGVREAFQGIYAFDNQIINEFDSFTETHFGDGAFTRAQFAVDAKGNFYEGRELEEVDFITKVPSFGGVFGEPEPLDQEPSSSVAVESSTGDPYVDNIGTVARFDPSGSLVERVGSGVLTKGSGLAVSSASNTLYVADAATDVIDIFDLQKPSKPTVEGEAVSSITGESATLQAEVNPLDAATDYHFEYGRCATSTTCAAGLYEQRAPSLDGNIPAGFGPEIIHVHVQMLRPHTTYHFRVVATNSFGTVDGNEHVFATQSTGEFELPDGRQWELVSPAKKNGALPEPISAEAVIQAARGGNAIAYPMDLPNETEAKGFALLEPALSVRTAGGWVTHDIGSAHQQETGVHPSHLDEDFFFSEDLSTAIVQPFGPFIPDSSPQALAPGEASEQTAFLRTNFLREEAQAYCEHECYRPLVSGAPGYANVPPGTAFGEESECESGRRGVCGPEAVGATPDARQVVLASAVPLTKAPIPAEGSGLYLWNVDNAPSEQLALISVLPGPHGEAARVPSFVAQGISENGSRIVWREGAVGGGGLYLRDAIRKRTIQLDAAEAACESEGHCVSGGGVFRAMSSDGSKVFFTDRQPLTQASGSGDLYECTVLEVAGELQCDLRDLTPLADGESAGVQQGVLGASSDGDYVYFVANGIQEGSTQAVRGNCKGQISGPGALCNLYAWHDGKTSLVAVVSGDDSPDWQGLEELRNGPTARVSPDGQWLAFMSQRPLTGYDNRDANSGEPDEEVFLYDSETDSLVCASCNPTGARPQGLRYNNAAEESNLSLASGDRLWPSTAWLAANIPAWTPYAEDQQAHQSRYLSNGGRLFFNSSDALVARDQNGLQEDVYEFEPAGEGNCASTTATGSMVFEPATNGCVGLVSSGASGEASAFLDASESGDDVFFLTTAKLARQDIDGSLDVYDAHVCSSTVPCSPEPPASSPACDTADSCRVAPSPPPAGFGPPSSATFTGAGNLTPMPTAHTKKKSVTRSQLLAQALKRCRRDTRKQRRSSCERHARKIYGATRGARKPRPKSKGGK